MDASRSPAINMRRKGALPLHRCQLGLDQQARAPTPSPEPERDIFRGEPRVLGRSWVLWLGPSLRGSELDALLRKLFETNTGRPPTRFSWVSASTSGLTSWRNQISQTTKGMAHQVDPLLACKFRARRTELICSNRGIRPGSIWAVVCASGDKINLSHVSGTIVAAAAR